MLLPVGVGIAVSFLIEYAIRPRVTPIWRRGAAACSIHVGIWLVLFGVELLIFRRPWLAAANVCVLMYVFVLISNAKLRSLREPFIFQDFDYCIDVLMHPRLYLPFLGVYSTLAGIGVIVLALSIGWIFEQSLLSTISLAQFVLLLTVVFTVGTACLWFGTSRHLPLTLDPQIDLSRLGLLAFLWQYGFAERSTQLSTSAVPFKNCTRIESGELSNLVVVQSESFFDVRKQFVFVRENVLKEYDVIKNSAVHFGEVIVPAWGANTVRTEFAFLSGLDETSLGVHRFNPYRKIARQAFPSLAGFLRSLGYRTICVHPYPASFYRRDRVYPLLGFDEFVDIQAFDARKQAGPYVDDLSLAEKVVQILEQDFPQPKFVFVITMENHGPLHWEKSRPEETEQYYSRGPAVGCDDLTIYLRHLRNADRMAGLLQRHLESLSTPSWLCWYGDHVPIMPDVYRFTGYPKGTTDYVIWRTSGKAAADARLDLKIEALGPLLLRKMGLSA